VWLQIVVIDKLDYCASKRNLDSCKDAPNFKVGAARASARMSLWRSAFLCIAILAVGRHSTDSVVCSQFIKADIQSADLISHVLQTEEIDTIMHFAAQVRTKMFKRAPAGAPKTNVCCPVSFLCDAF
jgi:dTDP-D-glucose 4,6-dehydratase